MKVVIDSQMRYGSWEDYSVYLIDIKKGKEKRVNKALVNLFAEPSKRDLYGTKEELGDTEDFFPYAFALVDQPPQ